MPRKKQPPPTGGLLKVADVAALLSLCKGSVRTLLAHGELEEVRIGGSVRITRESVDALVERGRVK
jgi:excisionase family DNA binding protein